MAITAIRKVSFRQLVQKFIQPRREDFGLEYLVADSAWYTAENLAMMNFSRFRNPRTGSGSD